MRAQRRAAELGLAAALAGGSVVLYRPVVRLWWLFDDLFQLRFVLRHDPPGYGFDPAVWGEIPNRLFTPLLMASLDLDATLFGAEPAPFYRHQLAALAAVVAALFLLLRAWLPRLWAALAVGLFLLGVPTASAVQQIMVRHYLEGLFFALAATGLFLVAVRRRRSAATLAAALASGVCFLLAAAAKEVFVPLPLLLVALDEGGLRRRLRCLAPQLVALALYVVWRRFMLGAFVGGYGVVTGAGELPSALLGLPLKVASAMADGRRVAGGLLLVALLLPIILTLRTRRRAGLALWAALLALLPVLPVSAAFEPRFALVAWLSLAVGFGFAGHRLAAQAGGRRTVAATAAVVALAAAGWVGRAHWSASLERLTLMSAEGRFFLELGEGDVLAHPLNPPATLGQVNAFEREREGHGRAAGWYQDDVYLCVEDTAAGASFWAWSEAARGRLENATARVREQKPTACAALDEERPLAARFTYRRGVLLWSLGPYRRGEYSLVLDGGRTRVPVAAEAGFRFRQPPRLEARVKYVSPEGWATYSPPLDLDFRRRGEVEWMRP